MAQFRAQGCMKLSSADNLVDSKNPVYKKLQNGGWLRFSDTSPLIHAYTVRRIANYRARFSVSSGKQTKQTVKVVASVDVSEEESFDLYDEFGDFDDDNLSCFRGLVLDISYRPVNVVCWKRAICLEFMEKADVLEYYDQTVNSPSGSFYIPAVLRVPHLLQVVKRKRIRNILSRKNILLRDGYACQYCDATHNLTIDHVLPIARGGKWTWDNLVTACAKCNSRKGQKTPEEANMPLFKAPKAPKEFDILAIPLTGAAVRMLRMRKGTPTEWRQYLSNI